MPQAGPAYCPHDIIVMNRKTNIFERIGNFNEFNGIVWFRWSRDVHCRFKLRPCIRVPETYLLRQVLMENTMRYNQPSSAIPAEKARQGEIILRKPWQRAAFIGGLVAAFLAVVAIPFLVR